MWATSLPPNFLRRSWLQSWRSAGVASPPAGRLTFGEPDRGHLRIGERDARHRSVIRDVPNVLARHDVAEQPPLVLPHVGEQRQTVHVAHGVQPVPFSAPNPKLLVDVEVPPL